MKPLISCWILLAIAGGIVPAAGQQPSGASYTPASLALELRRVERTLEESGDAQTLATLPLAWQVETPDRRYSISSEPLRVLLARQADPKEQAVNGTKAAVWLDHLADYLKDSGTPSPDSRSPARTELMRVLARPEFAGNAPPTRWDLFQQRVLTWIREILDRIFSFAAQHPSGSKILFWVVITGAIGILGNWLLRLWTQANQTMSLTAPGPARRVRTWEEWLRASRAAADGGDPREAIRLAYWAGIMRLQELRVLPVHTSKTPRENLRFLSEPRSGAAPASPAFQESLSGLTSGLERFWYAGRLAGPEDFRESLRHLEALGCKVD
ncbi:MAG: DUF4129 domain-containing protein [Bryobacteraceae bacterium]